MKEPNELRAIADQVERLGDSDADHRKVHELVKDLTDEDRAWLTAEASRRAQSHLDAAKRLKERVKALRQRPR